MAAQATLPLVIIGGALYAFHLLNGPVPKRELVGQIDEHSKGFHSFHYEHQLSTPATIVNPSPTSLPVYVRARHIAADGTVTHPLTPMHTTQDAVVEQRTNPHFDVKAPTLWLPDRHAWTEQAGQWSGSYRRMLRERYGVTGYQVKAGPTVHVDDGVEE